MQSLSEINRKISALKRINLTKCTDNYLFQAVFSLCGGFIFSTLRYSKGERFFRVRPNRDNENHLFKNISELWYPPKTTKYGRANIIGKSMLYITDEPDTALTELNLKRGDLITILELENTEDIGVQEIGILEYANTINLKKACEEIVQGKNGFYKTQANIQKDKIFRQFLVSEFTKKVPAGQDHLYRLSAAMAGALLTYQNCDGLLYPSIAKQLGDTNLAIKSSSADAKLKAKKVNVVRVVEVNGDKFTLACGHVADEFASDGTILYKENFDGIDWADKLEEAHANQLTKDYVIETLLKKLPVKF